MKLRSDILEAWFEQATSIKDTITEYESIKKVVSFADSIKVSSREFISKSLSDPENCEKDSQYLENLIIMFQCYFDINQAAKGIYYYINNYEQNIDVDELIDEIKESRQKLFTVCGRIEQEIYYCVFYLYLLSFIKINQNVSDDKQKKYMEAIRICDANTLKQEIHPDITASKLSGVPDMIAAFCRVSLEYDYINELKAEVENVTENLGYQGKKRLFQKDPIAVKMKEISRREKYNPIFECWRNDTRILESGNTENFIYKSYISKLPSSERKEIDYFINVMIGRGY